MARFITIYARGFLQNSATALCTVKKIKISVNSIMEVNKFFYVHPIVVFIIILT